MVLLFFHKKGDFAVKRELQRKREVKTKEAAFIDKLEPRQSLSFYFYV